MAQASTSLHEPAAELNPQLIERHRALVSLIEELEAIDWYDQRATACRDPELQGILIHNRDDEKEHAAMILEWLRRQDPELDAELRRYLFTDGAITKREGDTDADSKRSAQASAGSLQIGSLRAEVEP